MTVGCTKGSQHKSARRILFAKIHNFEKAELTPSGVCKFVLYIKTDRVNSQRYMIGATIFIAQHTVLVCPYPKATCPLIDDNTLVAVPVLSSLYVAKIKLCLSNHLFPKHC